MKREEKRHQAVLARIDKLLDAMREKNPAGYEQMTMRPFRPEQYDITAAIILLAMLSNPE